MNAAPVTAVVFGLVSVMVSVDGPPTFTPLGAKAFAIAGRASTVSVPETLAVVPAFAVAMAPVELLYVPADALITFTVTVHDEFASTVAPESATLLPLLAAVTVAPEHVVAPEAEAVFARPAG